MIESTIAVKQGCPSSLLLFRMYADDLGEAVAAHAAEKRFILQLAATTAASGPLQHLESLLLQANLNNRLAEVNLTAKYININ